MFPSHINNKEMIERYIYKQDNVNLLMMTLLITYFNLFKFKTKI